MFGLPLYSELLHGSALRTWNCVAHVVGVLWHKVVQGLGDINNMPRSRRRHHSRSRSRSNSHDRDREPKRRKVENFESPHSRRSVSSESEAIENVEKALNDCPIENIDAHSNNANDDSNVGEKMDTECNNTEEEVDLDKTNLTTASEVTQLDSDVSDTDCEGKELNTSLNVVTQIQVKDKTVCVETPQKAVMLTPKQIQKKLESEKKKAEKQRERDERHRAKQQERDEKLRQKQLEKDAKDAKLKEEREAKQREKDAKEAKLKEERELKQREKDAKRKEKEEKDKEREAKKIAVDEEKQKIEEKKQKAAAAFTKFFVAKNEQKPAKKIETPETYNFMPFQLKSDMRLAPTTRITLGCEEKDLLIELMQKQGFSDKYLNNLKVNARKSSKTWSWEDTDALITENIGEDLNTIKENRKRIKAKFLKFHENRRPAYCGTWRKKSKTISGKHPFAKDEVFNYEVDSDDEWEEEEEGEDIAGSDNDNDNDEENEKSENDYEVDNDFFVPHGHLSDDEGDGNDEEESITPEMRKAKEKLLRNQFDEERKSKTQRLKSRVIGCVWYNDNNNSDGAVDACIDQVLQPYRIIANGIVGIKKRSEFEVITKRKWSLKKEHKPDLVRLVHGNVHNKRALAIEFGEFLIQKSSDEVVQKSGIEKLIKSIARWGKCKVEGALFNKKCWIVNDDVLTEMNLSPRLSLQTANKWKYCTEIKNIKGSVTVTKDG